MTAPQRQSPPTPCERHCPPRNVVLTGGSPGLVIPRSSGGFCRYSRRQTPFGQA